MKISSIFSFVFRVNLDQKLMRIKTLITILYLILNGTLT